MLEMLVYLLSSDYSPFYQGRDTVRAQDKILTKRLILCSSLSLHLTNSALILPFVAIYCFRIQFSFLSLRP